MYIANVTNEYDNITSSNYTDYDKMTQTNCTNNENNIDKIIPSILLTVPCGLSFLCMLSLMVYILIKPLFNHKDMIAKLLYPTRPGRSIITGPSDCGKSVVLTNLFLNYTNEDNKIYIYSPYF